MIKTLEIKNFKSIKYLNLEFKNFNLFCGENAAGKTSTIHALLAVIQKNDERAGLDGELIKIGSFSDIRTRGVVGNVEIKIEDSTGNIKEMKLMRTEEGEQTEKIEKSSSKTSFDIEFEKELFYLSSNRIGVADTYFKGNQKFGTKGESFADFFSKYKNDYMPTDYINDFNQKYIELSNSTVEENIRFWFEYITEEKIKVVSIPNTNQYVLTYGSDEVIRTINTGSGLSYVIPIITICIGALLGKKCPTIIIENPEIYLHPEAQIKIAEFLMFISRHAQLIIETHSDHILKSILEDKKSRTNKVFVFKLENGLTQKIELTNISFKTNPISYSEVQYKAFGIPTPELHIILYSQLHNRFISTLPGIRTTRTNKKKQLWNESISKFENEYLLKKIGGDSTQKKIYVRKFVDGTQQIYKTLPTYIRNCIDHPNSMYSYTKEALKKSIEFMLSIL